jgi:aspartate racemase
LIISAFHEKQAEFGYPEIIIYSADLSSLLNILDAKDWDGLTDWLLEKVVALQKAGAEFAAIGSNTPHIVFDKVQSRSPIPMLSIIEETRKKAPEHPAARKLGVTEPPCHRVAHWGRHHQ